MPITAPLSQIASTFCADAAVAARAVLARRRCSPCRELGAGPCRAPKGGARLSRAPATTVISPCVLCAARHRAAAREHVDLQRRCRRCRPHRRGASALFALPRARRRPVPRADRAHLSRSLVTTVTSPRALCDAHHRAAVQERVDLLRQRRRRRPRRRGASTLLALLRARRRPVPRADRARLSRAPATTVTSPRLSCAAHHRAAAQ